MDGPERAVIFAVMHPRVLLASTTSLHERRWPRRRGESLAAVVFFSSPARSPTRLGSLPAVKPPTQAPDATRAHVLAGLADADGSVRVAAARLIVRERPDDVAAGLRGAIARERDPGVRAELVAALVHLGGEQLLREVAQALRNSDVAVVSGAARVLALLGDRRVVPNLLEAFRTENVVVGAAVAQALGDLGDPAAVPFLLSAVEQGFCVESACRALGRLGDRRAVPTLHRLVNADDPRVRLAAREAVFRFEERGELGDIAVAVVVDHQKG